MDSRLIALVLAVIALSGLGGCARLGYYTELARGQYELLQAREPIPPIIASKTRDEHLQRRLARVLDARRFAVEQLSLPDNESYTQYADLNRDYALWNVLATPEFSLEPVTDCFPIAGCVAYRGHYREVQARKQAEQFRAKGHDVAVGGVPAYSTLGWFEDPVLNTMMHWRDADLIGTVFHELAHQRIYARDDSAFNESFASFVERQGLRKYLGSSMAEDVASDRRRREFAELVLTVRKELEAIYQQELDPTAMRLAKQQKFSELRARYRSLRNDRWGGVDAYGWWFAQPLNNASLLPFGLYDRFVPAFQALFDQAQQDWDSFYRKVEALAEQPREARREALSELMEPSATP